MSSKDHLAPVPFGKRKNRIWHTVLNVGKELQKTSDKILGSLLCWERRLYNVLFCKFSSQNFGGLTNPYAQIHSDAFF